MTVVKENGFNILAIQTHIDESRYMNDRFDNLRKPGGSVAALKEHVSCFLN